MTCSVNFVRVPQYFSVQKINKSVTS